VTERLATKPPRVRNPRGEGSQLSGDIVTGAVALMERTGSADAVTLRAVAREVGIAAPSIYAHFAHRDAIVWAVMTQAFDEIAEAVEAAIASREDVVEQLVAGCEAYVTYGLAHPAVYRTLFSHELPPPEDGVKVADGTLPIGGEAFALLVDGIARCARAGRSTSTDTFADATAVWVALHGTVSLWSTLCDFPWPDEEGFVRRMTLSLARVPSS
jgi:AcrR family transcriptional regulator